VFDILDKVKSIFESGERVLFGEISRVVDLALICVKALGNMVLLELKGDIDDLKELAKKVYEMEKKADDLILGITLKITKGALATGIRENFLELSQKTDNLLDYSHFASREIVRMVQFSELRVSREMEQIFHKLIRITENLEKSVIKLKELLEVAQRSEEEAINIAMEIERLEEEIDELKEECLDDIYSISDKLSFYEFHHLTTLVHTLDNISDCCEDASNSIITIIRSLA